MRLDAGGEKLRLARLFGEGMVLQRDVALTVWGWAGAGARVCVALADACAEAVADEHGRWTAMFAPMAAGGPHVLTATDGRETITRGDVLIGDVWICGGQSNMELPMSRVAVRYPREMRATGCAAIRQFTVARGFDFAGMPEDFERGEWERATRENIARFYAAPYFFAKELHARYHVPIGLIACAAGGSSIAAWMSKDALANCPDALAEAEKWADPARVEDQRARDARACERWLSALDDADAGLKSLWQRGGIGGAPIGLTCDWAGRAQLAQNGAFWFEATFTIPERAAGKAATLVLGCIRDSDAAYVNGVMVGTTAYQYPPRRYEIPAGLLRAGENALVVRVVSFRGIGGFVAGKRYGIEIGGEWIDLGGMWRYRLGAVMDAPMPDPVCFEKEPSGLFNAMIAPSLKYAAKGVIWYQGESDAESPSGYAERFGALVRDWRDKRMGETPFLFVQLANYKTPYVPSEASGWSELRDEQRKCLSIPNTAMAVALDVGEDNDLHPLDKKSVAQRLALAARAVAYGEDDVEFSGPMFERALCDGDAVRISFAHNRGLWVKGGALALEVARQERHFIPTDVSIEADELVIRGAQSASFIRYAWADAPSGGLLYNEAGLPAPPFEGAVEPALNSIAPAMTSTPPSHVAEVGVSPAKT